MNLYFQASLNSTALLLEAKTVLVSFKEMFEN